MTHMNLRDLNLNKELKLRTEIQINITLGFWVKIPTLSSQELGMSIMDPKLHLTGL